jgi:hypothetical protein
LSATSSVSVTSAGLGRRRAGINGDTESLTLFRGWKLTNITRGEKRKGANFSLKAAL